MALTFSPQDVRLIATALLGDPNKRLSTKNELRFGSHGSMAVALDKGTWHSHEEDQGGGMLALIERETKLTGKDAFDWLRNQGIDIPDERGPQIAQDRPKANGADHKQDDEPPLRIVATFDYVDETGKLVFQVCRLEDGTTAKDGKPNKSFRQRRPDASARDGWTWKVQGVQQVPYRLQELQEAIAQDYVIFIAEGEKAVERLRSIGVPATCNAGGAGKWPDDLTPYFAGADVVILPDDDPQARTKDGKLRFHEDGRPVYPGFDHARLVASKLEGVARRIRVLQLTERHRKEDAYDWIEQGGNADLLYDLVDSRARVWPFPPEYVSRFSAVPWANLCDPGPKHEWLIKEILTRGERSMMSGASGSGKSFAAIDLSLSIARGVEYFGKRVMRGGVIYQAGEGALGMRKRLRAYMDVHGLKPSDPLPFVLLPSPIDLFSSDDHTNLLIAEIKHWAGTFDHRLELVVIDTLSAATPGANENTSEDVSRVLARCARIAHETGAHVMLVHHMNADGTKERGHTSIRANLDTVIRIERSETARDADNRRLHIAKLSKQKDGRDDLEWKFVLRSVPIGYDEDGDAITSLVVQPPAAGMDPSTLREAWEFNSERSKLLFSTLLEAMQKKGATTDGTIGRAPAGSTICTVEAWREEFKARVPAIADETPKSRNARIRQALNRALDSFQNWRLIGVDEDKVWLTGRPVKHFNVHSFIPRSDPDRRTETRIDIDGEDTI